MRVYVPATFAGVQRLHTDGYIEVEAGLCFAVTPAVREFYSAGDEDELADIVFDDAAAVSLRLLPVDVEDCAVPLPRRRVVVSADVEDCIATPTPQLGRGVVTLSPARIALRDIAAIHVDLDDAEAAVGRAVEAVAAADAGDEGAALTVGDAADHYLAWYDPSELRFLVELTEGS